MKGTEIATAGDALLGGMNSGSETALFTIERGGRVFSYLTESEGLGEGWNLAYQHHTGDRAGQARFRRRVLEWLAPY